MKKGPSFGSGIDNGLILLIAILWIIALVNVLRSEFTGNNILIWLLVVIFVPLIGSILYFIMGGKQKVRKGS